MIFRPASEEEFEAVKKKYQDVAEHTPEIRRYARWEYGKHPTDEGIRRYIDNGEMYLLMNGDEIAGMTAVVMYQERDYEAVQWRRCWIMIRLRRCIFLLSVRIIRENHWEEKYWTRLSAWHGRVEGGQYGWIL